MDNNTDHNAQHEEMPQELQQLAEEMEAVMAARVEAVGKYVAKKRDEAVKGRKASGIEQIWEEDLMHYEGVDDANRDQHPWLKSPSSTGGLVRNSASTPTRCTQFFNITRQFCDSASARMGDILLPAGDWNFAVKPTPVPSTSAAPEFGMDAAPSSDPQAMGAAPPDMGGMQPMMEGVSAPPTEQPADDADARAEQAEKWIQDKLVECQYHTEVRKAIEDAAIIGVGILKGPFPEKTTSKKAVQGANGFELRVEVGVNPASKRVDPQDFFPDPNCGEDIHKGSYVCERDRLSAKDLKDLADLPGYLKPQIEKVLDEGPGKKNYSDGYRSKDKTSDDDLYEVWYYYGLVDTAALCAMKAKMSESDAKKEFCPAVVTLVNDTPIKAFLNPLDSGEFPYDVMPWQRLSGHWAGIGVARQMRVPQQLFTASGRALADNMGLSSGPMTVIRQAAVVPADGKWELTARKVWLATEQADMRSVQDAFLAINIPSMQNELTANMQLAKSLAEDATGIFYLMQGQQGSAPDTVGGMELLHRNASAILRRIARVFDERITEPHIRRYYEWLLLHGPDDAKGDMQIQAIGSTALVEREIQAMQAQQLLQLSVNPVFGLDPEKAMVEVLKAQRFIPDKWTLDDAKKEQMAQQQPTIPAIEVAKLRAETEMQIAQMRMQSEEQRRAVDTDRDTAYNQALANRDQINAEVKIEQLKLQRELAMLDYANKHNIKLEEIKAKLASDAMKLRTQKELAGLEQVTEPPTEPPQHAEDGRAFEQ